MSFGIINQIYNDILLILKKDESNDTLSVIDLEKNKKMIFEELKKKYPSLNYLVIDEIFIRLFSKNYIFNKNILFDNGKNCFRELEDMYVDIKVPKKYKKIEEIFNKLKKMPQPVQRTQEWFDYRYNKITASDTAAALDLNPYECNESFILKKCDPNFPFRDNENVHHGKKYEPIATMVYEHIENNRVVEFGAIASEKHKILGASPDGICSKYTLDNKFSDKFGTMLEIKCPPRREIISKGKIIGEICPFYYYCQVQQQLECCELEVCDFWQCKITEYKSRKDYLNDNCESCIFTESINGTPVNVDNKIKKGIILEFHPKNFKPHPDYDDNIEWKSKYIIPKRLDLTEIEYDDWIVNIMDNYKNEYSDIYENYYFHKMIYWKLEKAHNVSIKKDDNFIDKIIPILQDTWNKIIYYRKNKDKLEELREIVKKKNKYIKFNNDYTISNDIIIKDKLLFLN